MDKLGQLVMTGISGLSLTEEEKSFIDAENIGGVILFARNYESPAQLGELVNSIQTLRQDYPLFISADHEGGRVQRFKNKFTVFPPMMKLAQSGSPKVCYEAHEIMGQELKAVGINLNFSPVCDIFSNPQNTVIGDRAFGHETEEVSKFVSAAIRGLQTNGVLACAKHFPGHGDTLLDSHFDLPVVKTSYEQMVQREFIPFVRASKSRVEFIMVAHLMVECFQESVPCSLGPRIYEILRKELKYQKIIISDDMEMKAVANKFSPAETATLAISSGCDIVLYQNFATAREAMTGLKQAVKTKRIKKADIEQKLERITQTKEKYLAQYSPLYIPDIESQLHTKRAQEFLNKIQVIK